MNQPAVVTAVSASSNRGLGWRTPEGSPRSGQGLIARTSFLRSVDLPFGSVTSELRRWRNRSDQGALIDVGRTLSMGRVCVDQGAARVSVVVHRHFGPIRRSVRMDLELSPVPGRRPITRMEMVARERVRSGRRYFRSGHRALDALVTELVRQSANQDRNAGAWTTYEEPRLAG
jgi:hypothetical protein